MIDVYQSIDSVLMKFVVPHLPPNFSQVLGMLLHSKAHLINSHILHLTYTLVGTVDSERSATISNPIAFRDLLASKINFIVVICIKAPPWLSLLRCDYN